MTRTLRVGSRDSRLAVAQAELAIARMRRLAPETDFTLVTMKTTGDRILDQTLDAVGGKGLFVKELDHALRDGAVDLTVHSYKDLPVPGPADLPVVAVLPRGDARDALILPEGAAGIDMARPVGTSSLRRRCQLARLFPAWRCEPVRGNVQTRLGKLDAGRFGGLVLAAAGLDRLGLRGRAYRVFEPDELLPAACQGILAVQGRAEDDHAWLAGLNCRDALDASVAERAFVEALGATCSAPVAAYAAVRGGEIRLSGMYADADDQMETRSLAGDRDNARALGYELARLFTKV